MMRLQIITEAEEKLWNDMCETAKKRNNYHFKRRYYPFNIDLWERENKEIETSYRNQILILNQKRNKNTEVPETLLELTQTNQKKNNIKQFDVRRSKRILTKNQNSLQ